MKRTWMCLLLAAATGLLVAVPATSARPTPIKLTGVVVGHSTSKSVAQTIVSVRRGSKKVGKLTIGSASCAGTVCVSGGTTNLKVGKVKGPAKLDLRFKVGGGLACLEGVKGACKPATSGTGKITKSGVTEPIRVNTGDPSKVPVGGHFGIVLG